MSEQASLFTGPAPAKPTRPTGGTWRVSRGQLVPEGARTVADVCYLEPHSNVLRSLLVVTDATEYGDPEADANLIAAAPLLRDALRVTLGNLRSIAGNHPAVYGEWLKVVEAALAASVPPEPGR